MSSALEHWLSLESSKQPLQSSSHPNQVHFFFHITRYQINFLISVFLISYICFVIIMDSPTTSKRPSQYSAIYFKASWEEDYFFIEFGDAAKCLLCRRQLNQLKKYNVQRHYKTYHEMDHISFTPEQRREKIQALKVQLLEEEEQEEDDVPKERNATMHEKILEASYKIAYEIGKTSLPLHVGDLIKNSMTIAAQSLFPNEINKISALGLSIPNVARRVREISENITDQLCIAIQNFIAFSLAIDKTTDITGSPQLAIFIRGVDAKLNVVEELLEFSEMRGTTAEDVLSYVEEIIIEYELDWHNLVSVATDGTPFMVGRTTGFINLLKQKLHQLPIPHSILSVQSILHCENLCAINRRLYAVMSDIARVINFVRRCELKQTQLRRFLQELDSDYGELPNHTDIRWLSRGKALDGFFNLREEIRKFMDSAGSPVPELADPNWVKDLAFLSDLVDHLNIFNAKLQARNKTIIDLFDTVRAFKMRLGLWIKHLESGQHFDFPKLKSVSSDNTYEHYLRVLQNLSDQFSERFADITTLESSFDIITSPFTANYNTVSPHLRTELVDLRCDRVLQFQFEKHFSNLPEFYKTLPQEKYPQLHKSAAQIISIFGSTYLCDQLFSILKRIKSTNRFSGTNRNTRSVLILNTCQSFVPNFNRLLARKEREKCERNDSSD
ncbi:general transcription factor II-I repeat domain-containing protein 2-like [Lasioglossum baleicum]|uniref:general transcription factor II-I repeat domain-containing protein 2-like n=1 Tax=Lasioglossum baleicum TaxID=434251 RepID=UPI003FCE17CB